MAAQSGQKHDGSLGEIWDVLREHHTDVGGLKIKVDGAVAAINTVSTKVDEIFAAVTRATARQGPSLMELMGGLVLLLTIVGGLATGVGVFVASTYSGTITDLTGKSDTAVSRLAERDAEDRAELARLRGVERSGIDRRISALEAHAGWATQVSPTP